MLFERTQRSIPSARNHRCESRKTKSRHESFIRATAIPTLRIIDEANGELSDADSAGTTATDRPHRPMLERIAMNAKLLYAATLGLALASSLALADEAPITRAAVIADFQQAARAGQLHRNDYADELASRPPLESQVPRAQVLAELMAPRDPRLVGPLRNRSYNQFGTELMREPIYSRADVKADVLQARAEHTLRPAGEAGDLYVAATPRREVPAFLARLTHRGN